MKISYACDKKCSFFGNIGVLYFFETPVLRFALLPYADNLIIFFGYVCCVTIPHFSL